MDNFSVFNSSSALSSKDLDRSSNRTFKESLLAFSLTDFFTSDFFTFFNGLVVVFFVAVAVVSARVVTAATSAEANACFLKTISSCLIFVYLNPYIYSEQSKKKKHISYFLSRNSIYTFELGTSNLGTRSKILKIYRFCDVASQLVDF